MCGVRNALYPVFLLAGIFGLQMFEYQPLLLNHIHYTVLWSSYIIIFIILWIWTEFSDIFRSMYGFLVTFNIITGIVVSGLTVRHKKKFETCLKGLAIVNTSLRHFNVPDEYSELHKFMWKMITIWWFIMIYFIGIDAIWMIRMLGKVTGIVTIVMLNYPVCIILLNYIIICLILRYTDSRFDEINKYVEGLTEHSNNKTNWLFRWQCGMYDLLDPVLIKKQERRIWIIMHIHTELCKISRDFNRVFGLQFTLEIGTYFVYLCGMITFSCKMLSDIDCTTPDNCLPMVIIARLFYTWSKGVFCIVRLIYFNHVCESISNKANDTRQLMHNLINSTNDVQSHTELVQFVLQMVNRPLKFRAAGMFYFGYSCIYTSFAAMSTLIVIILQSSSIEEQIRTFLSKYTRNGTFAIDS